MDVIQTEFPDVVILVPKVFADHRGYFCESYNRGVFESLGIRSDLVQDNHSLTVEKGTIRGLHYQLRPMAQTKIVRCLVGEIYDVVVDLRRGSPNYGRWLARTLSAENKYQLVVPQGFAHGFCTLTPNVEVLYKVDAYYAPKQDRGIIWNDPDLNITWPVNQPVLSDKDTRLPKFKDAEINF